MDRTPATSEQLDRIEWLVRHGKTLLAAEPSAHTKLLAWQMELLRRQRELQWRSRERFPDAARWLWTDRSLSQASDYWSATYKAQLFPPHELVIDACCGAGVDLTAIGLRGPTCGIDSDARLCLLAQSNAAAHGCNVEVTCARLPQAWIDQGAWLHIDPDRRTSRGKTTEAALFSPSLEDVQSLVARTRGAVVKLAPSTEFTGEMQAWIESQAARLWVGSRGECRQQLLLTGALQNTFPTLRAAVLSEPRFPTPGAWELRTHQFAGELMEAIEADAGPCDYVYDLHPVLHASGLAPAWAQAHSLRSVGGEHGYYTDSALIRSPWSQPYRVLDILAWDDRQVRKWLRQAGAGLVEVKCRLHRMDAAAAQRRYSSTSGRPFTLLVTRLGQRVRAIAAERP